MKHHGLSLLSLAGAALGGSLLSYGLFDGRMVRATAPMAAVAAAPLPAAPHCDMQISRVSGYDRVRPLLSAEPVCESPRLTGLRSSIAALVTDLKATGQVSSASVYVRDFGQSGWTVYNGTEAYDPGSLLKVPLLLTYLSMSEEDPSLLQRMWACEAADFNTPQVTAFPSEQAQLNVTYPVNKLLDLSITRSDNHATSVLFRHTTQGRYGRTFTELGLPAPDWYSKTYRMNVKDYSLFMKALYNSSLLSPLNSERALELMTRSDFKAGLVAGLPQGVEVAHKFGEAGDPAEKQLHETGLVYLEGNPYLITIMTRGQQTEALAGGIASISRLVYEHMRSN